MKVFNWDINKNEFLKKKRGVSFEQAVEAISRGDILDITLNMSKNHPDQWCYVLLLKGYPHLVPFAENEKERFLKTIIPSRKHKKKER